MSRENAEVVLDQFEATNERDFERAMGHYADEVELTVDPAAFLNGGTFRGKQAVGQWFADWFATFEPGYHFDVNEVRDLGESILLVATHYGRGLASGARVSGENGYLYELRGGRVVRLSLFSGAANALEATGTVE